MAPKELKTVWWEMLGTGSAECEPIWHHTLGTYVTPLKLTSFDVTAAFAGTAAGAAELQEQQAEADWHARVPKETGVGHGSTKREEKRRQLISQQFSALLAFWGAVRGAGIRGLEIVFGVGHDYA